jgi:hypothetical protein
MKEWYFDSYSDEYGTERFGSYDTTEDALKGIIRVQKKAASLADNIQRFYSAPYNSVN